MLLGGAYKPKGLFGGFAQGGQDMTPQAMPQPAMANPMVAMSGQMAQTSNALASLAILWRAPTFAILPYQR